jgi:hypothetical protein
MSQQGAYKKISPAYRDDAYSVLTMATRNIFTNPVIFVRMPYI